MVRARPPVSARQWSCRWPWLPLWLGLATDVAAGELSLRELRIDGVDEAARRNLMAGLSLARLGPEQRISEQRLDYLLRQTPRQLRTALEPLGYYRAEVEIRSQREGDAVSLRLRVRPGTPVRIGQAQVWIAGEGREDAALQAAVSDFRPAPGEVLDHGRYETSKSLLRRRLEARGYFAASLQEARVEVDPAADRADIRLGWDSGPRYRLGAVRFEGHALRADLFDPLVDWPADAPFDEERLLRLQRRLLDLDYFTAVDVHADVEAAEALTVPIRVGLLPAARRQFRTGLRYGSDTGVGLSAGYTQRWLNSAGHRWSSELALSDRLSELGSQYRLPDFRHGGWYALRAAVRDERLPDLDSRLLEVGASRNGRWRDWQWLAGLTWQRERFDKAGDGRDYRYATLVYPSLSAQWSQGDDPLYPRRGRALAGELRLGSSALGSDADFLQLRVEGRYLRGLGERHRLLLRAELGSTLTDAFAAVPPSQRFFAGGDRSVRGYGFKRIGRGDETIRRDAEQLGGGRHLLVASIELERTLSSRWAVAAFVDAGDAFVDRPRAQVGAGLGLRWRSPIGPVRLDLAHGFGVDAEQALRLHLGIGPEL